MVKFTETEVSRNEDIRKDKQMIEYGICDCGKWGEAPKEFNESKHFLRCECGKFMYLNRFNPREVGYKEEKKINITFERQR